jgi:DnaJ domain
MIQTYYDLLGLPRTASFDDVKHAFRREIAKYHPDKVQHLGPEFEEIAASKAAVLTQAYKTLGDADARAQYDATLGAHDHTASTTVHDEAPASAPVEEAPLADPSPPEIDRGHDVVRRATVLRFRHALELEFGPHDQWTVNGFDVACAPSRAGLFSKRPPRVLGRVVPQVDASAIAEAWGLAARTTVHRKRDLCVFVMGPVVAPAGELAAAIKKERARPATAAGRVVVVPINSRSWQAHIPTDAPPVVKSLVERLKSA